MAQIAKVIDVTRTFLPIDPESFAENMMYTEQQDVPEKMAPVSAISGYNFLPTSYGYRSYFGLNSTLDIPALPGSCDKVLLFQLSNYKNVLIAFCDTGIWTNVGTTWTQQVVSTPAGAGAYLGWTTALIENTLYMYRQGEAHVYSLSYTGWTPEVLPTTNTPVSFLMAGVTPSAGVGTVASPYLITNAGVPHSYTLRSPNRAAMEVTVVGDTTELIGVTCLSYNIVDIATETSTPGTMVSDGANNFGGTISVPADSYLALNFSAISDASIIVTDALLADVFAFATDDSISVIDTIAPLGASVTGVGSTDSPYVLTSGVTELAGLLDGTATHMFVSTQVEVFVYLAAISPVVVPAGSINFSIPVTGETAFSVVPQDVGQVDSIIFRDVNYASIGITLTVVTGTPTFLNMVGQMGIFRANGRLGFWDSANSVSWSSLFNTMDFTPAIETLAGNRIFNAVIGRIVSILSQGDGFVIYSTKSITGVRYSAVDNNLWEASSVTDVAGIAYPSQVCTGLTEKEHFAYTNTGLKRIGAYNAINKSHAYEDILPDLYDFLKENRDPIKLDLMNGRYLFLSLINPNYITGKTLFVVSTVGSLEYRILFNGTTWDGVSNRTTQVSTTPFVYGTPDTTNVTLTINNYLAQRFQLASYVNSFYQWSVQGEEFLPVGESSSYIVPYTLDGSTDLHIPNAAPVTTPFFSLADIQALLTSNSTAATIAGLIPSAEKTPTISLAPTYKELGWTITGGAGQLDRRLHTFSYIQTLEWLEYAARCTMTAAEIAALDGVELGGAPVILGGYQTDAEATAVLSANYTTALTALPGYTTLPHDSSTLHLVEVSPEALLTLHTAPPAITPPTEVILGASYYPVTIEPIVVAETLQEITRDYRAKKTAVFSSGVQLGNTRTIRWQREIDMAFSVMVPHASDIPITHLFPADFNQNTGISDSLSSAGVKTSMLSTIGAWYDSLPLTLTGVLLGFDAVAVPQAIVVHTDPIDPDPNGASAVGRIVNYVVQTGPLTGTIAASITMKICKGRRGVSDDTWVGDPLYWRYNPTGYNWVRAVVRTSNSLTVTPEQVLPVANQLTSTMRAYQDVEKVGYIKAGITDAYGESWVSASGAYYVAATDIPTIQSSPVDSTVTYPGATFTLQDGSIAPIYPTYAGALVLDLGLKKWGKVSASYKALVDYQPVNKGDSPIAYTNFGIDMGVFTAAGTLQLFDAHPATSLLTYGKIGYNRLGMTDVDEVRADFRNSSTGTLTLESSLDGRGLEFGYNNITSFTNAGTVTAYPSATGRWHTITISGNYDLQFLEFRGTMAGRR